MQLYNQWYVSSVGIQKPKAQNQKPKVLFYGECFNINRPPIIALTSEEARQDQAASHSSVNCSLDRSLNWSKTQVLLYRSFT